MHLFDGIPWKIEHPQSLTWIMIIHKYIQGSTSPEAIINQQGLWGFEHCTSSSCFLKVGYIPKQFVSPKELLGWLWGPPLWKPTPVVKTSKFGHPMRFRGFLSHGGSPVVTVWLFQYQSSWLNDSDDLATPDDLTIFRRTSSLQGKEMKDMFFCPQHVLHAPQVFHHIHVHRDFSGFM